MEIKEILNNFSKARIAVVGDVMLDSYVYGNVERVSPEAPVPVVKINKEIFELGGAGNVAENVSSLGGEVCLFGYIGNDQAGKILLDKLNEYKIKNHLFPVLRETIQKTRIVGNNQQITRIDKEERIILTKEIEEVLISQIFIYNPDILIISDYAKGTITENLISKIKNRGIKIIIAPKPESKIDCSNIYLILPNLKEVKEITGLKNVEDAGRMLQEKYNSNVLITKGKDGMTLFEKDKIINLPTQAKEVYDVSGAGDTVVASLGLSLASGASLEQAAVLANHAAGIVVSKSGTATVFKNELEQVLQLEHTKLKTLNELKIIREDLKRKDKKVVFTGGCYDVLHPGHIEFLKKAKSYGDVLILAMNSDKSPFFKTKGKDRPILNQDQRIRVLSGLESVDYIIPFDEDTSLWLIKELKPDVKVKGGTYVPERVAEEDEFLKTYGGVAEYVGLIGDFSTTKLIEKIRNGKSE